MSNIIIDTLPLTIPVGGRDLPIETNFRTGMLFELMMMSGEVPEEEKIEYAVNLYFPNEFPRSAAEQREAIDGMLWFYMCGDQERREPAANGSGSSDKPSIVKRIYDYEVDAPMIYAAFLSQYGIDLQDVEYLHWWTFVGYYMEIGDCTFSTIISIRRKQQQHKPLEKWEKEFYSENREIVDLPAARFTADEDDFMKKLFGGGPSG